MASGILVDIQEEVTCPICMDLLREPLILDCSHVFCQACILANDEESVTAQEGDKSCPVCRISYQPKKLRPIRLLTNIVEKLREVKLSPEEKKRDLCVRHGEKLLLFCEKDGKVICWLCERSQEHRGHQTFLLEESAQKYQEKLQATLGQLSEKKAEAEELRAHIREEKNSWQNQIEAEIQIVQAEFKQLREILDTKELEEEQKLSKEQEGIFSCLNKADSELIQQSQLVQELTSDVERRLQGSLMEMLQDVNDVIERSETLTLTKPQTFPMVRRRKFKVPDLKGMLQMFDELRDMQCYWDYVTLDVSFEKPSIAISEDQREVRFVRNQYLYNANQYNYENYSVMGSTAITPGKHYWEVDVSHKTAWLLGVCCKNYSRSTIKLMNKLAENRGKYNTDVCTLYQPKHGYWVIGLVNGYNVFEDSFTDNTKALTLPMTIPPHRVGIFLDHEAQTVSFYNITNHGFLIYKFSSCQFSNYIFPYFNPMTCESPMTLCSPSS